MTAVSQPPPPVVSENGSSPSAMLQPVGLPVPPKRQRNTVWMVGGLVLMLVAAVAALSIGRSLADRQSILISGRNIAAGEPIVEADLTVTAAALPAEVESVDPNQIADLVGMVAKESIVKGSVLRLDNFAPADESSSDLGILGAELGPGNYPRIGLQPGDQVLMIEVARAVAGTDFVSEAKALGEAEVVETARLSGADRLLVSLRLDSGLSVSVSQVADEERLRLVLVETVDARTVAPLDPVEPADPVTDPESSSESEPEPEPGTDG